MIKETTVVLEPEDMKNTEDKYYTPTMDEFHIGFEYETNYNKNKWEKETISNDRDAACFFDDYHYDVVENEFRVKYLDKEDIESLGFIQSFRETYFENNNKDQIYLYDSENMNLEIYSNDYDKLVFRGLIKNKSELQRLLKQLNI